MLRLAYNTSARASCSGVVRSDSILDRPIVIEMQEQGTNPSYVNEWKEPSGVVKAKHFAVRLALVAPSVHPLKTETSIRSELTCPAVLCFTNNFNCCREHGSTSITEGLRTAHSPQVSFNIQVERSTSTAASR